MFGDFDFRVMAAGAALPIARIAAVQAVALTVANTLPVIGVAAVAAVAGYGIYKGWKYAQGEDS